MLVQVLERFLAQSADGKYKTTIVVTQELLDASSLDGYGTVSGLKRATTESGHHCNYRGPDAFEVLDPQRFGVIVQRIA